MSDPRQELIELRRIAELEAKAPKAEPSLMERLAGPTPKLPGNPYGVNDAVEQVTTPHGVNEIAAMELAGKAGGAVINTGLKTGGEILKSPAGQFMLHKTGLSKVGKIVPELWNSLKGAVRPGMEVAEGPAGEVAVDAAFPAALRKAPQVNNELTEALAKEVRPTPSLEAPSPSISRPTNPELTDALSPAPAVELGPMAPTAPRTGSKGPSLEDILAYAKQAETPATAQPGALESTLATALKPRWTGPKLLKRGSIE